MKNEEDLSLGDRLNAVLEAEFKSIMAILKNGALFVSESLKFFIPLRKKACCSRGSVLCIVLKSFSRKVS
jgi:hypothetical protein